MEINDFMEDLKDNFDDVVHNKPHIFITVILIVILFLAGLVILLIQTSTKKAKEAAKTEFVADAPVMIPDPPNVEKDYYQYRTTPERWSREDLEKWFTYPDEKIMNQIEKANDKIVDEITGVAP